jgi:PKD repeat protein
MQRQIIIKLMLIRWLGGPRQAGKNSAGEWHGSGEYRGSKVVRGHAHRLHLLSTYFIALSWEDSMRSIGVFAVVAGMLVLALACSDGAGTPPPDNAAPVAGFSEVCTNLTCVFTDASTDPDGNSTITRRSWSFGDGTSNGELNPTHTYTTAGIKTVALTVTDNAGATHTVSKEITVTEGPAGNQAPVAGFTFVATGTSVAFTNTSTDEDGTLTYLWNFGEPSSGESNESTLQDPTHAYTVTAPATFTVTLTVTDNAGATDVETQTVSLTPVPNTPPTAGFTYTCNGPNCSFTSTSTDVAPGTITTYAWTFGDAATSSEPSPQHLYVITAPRTFTVTLTVTDNGGATDVETQTVAVSPPVAGAEGCFTKTIGSPARAVVDCAFNVPTKSTMKVKLLGINCDIEGQRLVAPPPIGDQMFLAVCEKTVGQEIGIFGGPLDELIVYEAGSQVVIRFFQGFADRFHPVLVPPSATFEGTFPDWTIHYEDGSEPGEAGEPDFADLIVGLHATVVP